MEEYTLTFCKLIKHNESLLEVILNEGTHLNIYHANEANDILNRIFKEPYGVLVDIRNDVMSSFEGGVTIGNSKLEKRVALLIRRKNTENTVRCIMLMQKEGFPEKELKIFYDRKSAINWLEEI
jgi:hypothetical protein